jgi:GT2 family glycosyltransferase
VNGPTPALSVILTTRGGWAPVARTIRYLGEQTVADRVELVLVLLDGKPPEGDPPEGVQRLSSHRLVPAPEANSIAQANTAGAREARAPVVAMSEDHAFPEPGWAEALLARHEEPWAVVGPVVRNANPDTVVSWADFVLSYGPFAVGGPGGEVEFAPGHNASYKRAVLERQGDRLDDALAAEWVFHIRLRDEGERVCVEPAAVIRHVNFSRLRPFIVHAFRGGRSHAAVRAMSWSTPRRVVYAIGCVVLPALRVVRLARALPSEQRRRLPVLALPIAFAGLVMDAAGQAAGFATTDPQDVHGNLLELELDRVKYVSAADAAALW